MIVPAGNLPAPSAHIVYVVLIRVCDINLYLGLISTMPSASAALLLRASVLCTVCTTTAAATVVLVEWGAA